MAKAIIISEINIVTRSSDQWPDDDVVKIASRDEALVCGETPVKAGEMKS